ncbi:helix-turn-helix transcriptional regulator, partial [Methylomonas koyamae]
MPNFNFSNIAQTQRERLFHIDFRLFFLGTVNRNDLVARFGIKEAAATRDITLYKELAPKNLEYDTKVKTYIQRDGFSPLFSFSTHQALAALLHGYGDDFVSGNHTFDAAEAPTQLHLPACDILAFVTRAIYCKQAISISYRSLSSGLTQREIVPHSLIDTGLRWHVRAFDRLKQQFSDFVINRIEQPRLIDNRMISDTESKGADQQWNQFVELQLIPHPSLRHPETIAHEYGFENGELTLSVRAAVAGYVLRRWNVDCSENHALVGTEYHLWLKNRQTLAEIGNLVLAPGYSAMSYCQIW